MIHGNWAQSVLMLLGPRRLGGQNAHEIAYLNDRRWRADQELFGGNNGYSLQTQPRVARCVV
jgi:hypothetical protein